MKLGLNLRINLKWKPGARKRDSGNLSSEKASVPCVVLHGEIVLARPMGYWMKWHRQCCRFLKHLLRWCIPLFTG